MKTYLYTLIVIAGLSLVSVAANAQISYSYDAAGNRTSRTIVFSKSGEIETTSGDSTIVDPPENNEEELFNQLGDIQLTLYPNPTQGYIKINAENIPTNAVCEILVYGPKGTLIIQQAWSSGASMVDLSSQPQGTYFVKFTANGKVTQWKVIKE